MKNLSWFKRNRNILRVIAINILLIFIGLESISLGFYLIENHQLYYTRGQNQDTKIVKNLEQAGINLDQSIIQRLHPFFGYVIKPGNYPKQFSVAVNRHGFLTPYEYPFIRSNSNQFIVGVFGGSVASIFAVNDNVSQGFTKKLKNFPDLANKEIIVMDFASGGYKQPQQLLILNYFLAIGQTFDVVINIDGFNEVALSNLNNQGQIDISMPSIQHIQPLTGLANNTLSLDLMSLVVSIKVNLLISINHEKNNYLYFNRLDIPSNH